MQTQSRQVQCEVCGVPATAWVQDVRQGPPEGAYHTYVALGKHFFCSGHDRPSLKHAIDGRAGYYVEDGNVSRRQDWNGDAE